MAELLEQISAEHSVLRTGKIEAAWRQHQHYCRNGFESNVQSYHPSQDDNFLYELLVKGLARGTFPFGSWCSEQWVNQIYGAPYHLKEENPNNQKHGSITYSFDSAFREDCQSFTDFLEPWSGSSLDVSFDPDHPDNERLLFEKLITAFGPKIAQCISPQVELSTVLAGNEAEAFLSQRLDLLLEFPNGQCLVLEPGDHDADAQIQLDRRRDAAFGCIGIESLRPRNQEIQTDALIREISERLEKLDVLSYLETPVQRNEQQVATNYILLLPTLIARIERLLAHFMFRQGLVHREELIIGFIERDLACAEVGIASFFDKVERLSRLYGIERKLPRIQVYVCRNPNYQYSDLSDLDIPVSECDDVIDVGCDIILDVGVKCGVLTQPIKAGASHIGWTRRSHPHNRAHRFGYLAKPRSIQVDENTETLLASFVQDFFRKYSLRQGQGPVLCNALSQKSTIALLPTSAGKSLCYQLSALLTPGTTIVIDPLVALMKDQVQSLTDLYGIDRVFAWHAGARIHERNLTALLGENSIIFISPERLQRPSFRSAMRSLNAADIFINYAVVDEAHCVSMWGHDFRPSYLTLEKNIKEFCRFEGRTPVMLALTGTASQLVLIDLKRELNIREMDAIIRPATFDRPELNFNLVRCANDDKWSTLKAVSQGVASRLNVQDLHAQAHGIIFTYTPKEAWRLMGEYVANAAEMVQSELAGDNTLSTVGMYSGSPPKEGKPPQPLFSRENWDKYKEETLAAFKRGRIRTLIGNTAVSVGIDNEYLNYVINFRMPQSMEAYYQQCGRAGRNGQHSECYLIMSDDHPQMTQQWLSREIEDMPSRWDDLGTVAYFHQSNFPGQQTDVDSAMEVCKLIFNPANAQGLVEIPSYYKAGMTLYQADRTERYISYWLILGVLDDYEVEGMAGNTVYRVRRSDAVEDYIRTKEKAPLEGHVTEHLHDYFIRYRPLPKRATLEKLNTYDGAFSNKSISCLIGFIYEWIEYQRRESIRAIVEYCSQKDANPETLRTQIRGYFDSSEKFSDGLMQLADTDLDVLLMSELISRVESFDDVEHLYWETRRLLDERYRADWGAINLYALIYREQGALSEIKSKAIISILEDLRGQVSIDELQVEGFLVAMISSIVSLKKVFAAETIMKTLISIFETLYNRFHTQYLVLLEQVGLSEGDRNTIHASIAVKQMKEINDAKYSRCFG